MNKLNKCNNYINAFFHYRFKKFTSKQASKAAAVSVRRRLSPKVMALKSLFNASSISFGVKSPSGPINIKYSPLSSMDTPSK